MWPILTLLLLPFVSLSAQADLRTEIVETQRPVLPPLSPGANTESLNLWPAKAAKIVARKLDAQGKVYEYTARHNAYGFRITDRPHAATPTTRHIFLGGCSFTYGMGLAVEKTFFGWLDEHLPKHRVVNMGVGGGSPAEALYLWRNFDWQKVYPETTGFFVFTLIPAHYGRLTRNWGYLSWANEHAPAFDDELQSSRSVGQLWEKKLAGVMNALGLNYWWLRLTSHFMDRDPEEFTSVTVRYLLAMKTEYLKRYPQGHFVLTWMNFQPPTFAPGDVPGFLAALKRAEIDYWEPSAELSHSPDEYRIPRDAHPSAQAHREHGEFLLSRIRQSEK